jgi:hypothetical protein
VTYRHYVLTQPHPYVPWVKRHVCLCGWNGGWRLRLTEPSHPHLIATVSSTDLTPISAGTPVQSVEKFTDGTWLVTYKCGHQAHGVSDFDLARARRNHTLAECQKGDR